MDGEDVGALYRRYVDEYARFAFQEFDFLHLLKDQSATPEGFAFEAPFSRQKLRFRGVIRHEIEWIKASYAEEFEHLCDALADGAQLDAWLDDVIAHDPVYGSVARERREAFRRELRRDLLPRMRYRRQQSPRAKPFRMRGQNRSLSLRASRLSMTSFGPSPRRPSLALFPLRALS